jgi:hypothetical protein
VALSCVYPLFLRPLSFAFRVSCGHNSVLAFIAFNASSRFGYSGSMQFPNPVFNLFSRLDGSIRVLIERVDGMLNAHNLCARLAAIRAFIVDGLAQTYRLKIYSSRHHDFTLVASCSVGWFGGVIGGFL